MSDTTGGKAVYTKSLIPEFAGNPLIEALPPLDEDTSVLRTMFKEPSFNEVERQLPAAVRRKLTHRAFDLVCPTPLYLDLYRGIEDMLYEGYGAKNPFSPTTSHWLYYLDGAETKVAPKTGVFKSRALAATLIGLSGVGKTTMIQRVLDFFPQIIEHKQYGNNPLTMTQLVWLYVECPESASISAFCRAILKAIDDALGTEYAKGTKRMSIDLLRDQVDKAVRNTFLGIIVVDELQNMSVQKSGGRKSLLAFLLRLVNQAGVPFLGSGTPDLPNLVQDSLKTARRFEAGGYFEHRPLDQELWDLFIERLWKYQWTAEYTPLTAELSSELFVRSRGIHDFAVRTFAEAQRTAISNRTERITVAALQRAFVEATQLSNAELTAMRPPQDASQYDSNEDATTSVDGEKADNKYDSAKSVREGFAFNRIQHPELEGPITDATTREILVPDSLPQHILRDLVESSDIMGDLEESGRLLLDPQSPFAGLD